MHSPDALKALEVPQLDGHVRRAGGQQFASLVEGDVLHRVCVAFQCALKVSCLVVPHLREESKQHTIFNKDKTYMKNKKQKTVHLLEHS